MADFSMSGGAPARIGKSAPGSKRATGLLASDPPAKTHNWIAKAAPKSHKGALHRALGVPASKPIPAAKEAAAAKKGGKVGKEARLAEEFKGFKK